jgi:hypothetical protein
MKVKMQTLPQMIQHWDDLQNAHTTEKTNIKLILKGNCPMECVEILQLSGIQWYSEKGSRVQTLPSQIFWIYENEKYIIMKGRTIITV